MTTAEIATKIQDKFDINHIYAKSIASFLDLSLAEPVILSEAEKIIKDKPKPFVKWVGGKRQLLKQFQLMGLYPPEYFDPKKSTYFEPFVGGGAVFFDLLPINGVLSDLNFELITTYNVIRDSVEDLIKSLKKHKYEKEYFLDIRANNPQEMFPLDIASRFIYLNRTCFNGMYRVNSKGGFNVPFGKYSNPLICDEENLRKVSESLQGVEARHEDYQKVLERAKKGDFIYFDPPYHPLNETSSFTSYTSNGFSREDQAELRDTFLKLHRKGCFVMLSNSNTDFINELYSNLDGKIKIHKVDASRMINSNASKRGKIKEVLVVNY